MHKDSSPGERSTFWKIGSEAIVNLGGGRAVLMQLAHPLVAMGVHVHSRYMTDPVGRATSTFILGQLLAFGPPKTVQQAARTINRLHSHVHGTLPFEAGAHARGTGYRARDPELLLWVHATLVDTVLQLYQLAIQPLSEAEQDSYYQESKYMARLLGLSPQDMPATIVDLQHYMHDIIHSNILAATPEARRLAQQVLFPRLTEPATTVLRPFMHLNLQITCALLPQPIRDIYGLAWGASQQKAFDVSMQGVRFILPHLPSTLRVLPISRRLIEQSAFCTS